MITLNDKPLYGAKPQDDSYAIVTIDVARLIETRMLVQANSGGGKSRTLRRIFEQTYGHVQHIIIDWDGEFHTLREKFDYVLAAPHGGEAVASIASASLLARRLLELGTSAIVDISELGPQRIKFVRLFIESLMVAPRDLWHPVLIGIDEAHRFAPEAPTTKDEYECAAALVALMSDGRKRGFCGLLATQRISKLDKNAAAECNNLLIGRASLDLDIRRAAGVIGMSVKDAKDALPHLAAGEFFVVGPALTPTVERISMGSVVTTHPTAGTGGGPPTPPRKKALAILAKLADLPAEAEEELKTTEQLRAKVRELEGKLKAAPDGSARAREGYAIGLAEAARDLEAEKNWNGVLEILLDDVTKDLDKSIAQAQALVETLHDARNLIPNRLEDEAGKVTDRAGRTKAVASAIRATGGIPVEVARQVESRGDDGMPAMQRAMLTALAQRGPLTKAKLLVFTGYSRGGATSKAFAEIAANGWVEGQGFLQITSDGKRALGRWEPLPTGAALRAKIIGELADMERKIFDVVCQSYPQSVAKQDVLYHTGYARGGATSKAFAYLVGHDYLVADGPGRLVAPKDLFE